MYPLRSIMCSFSNILVLCCVLLLLSTLWVLTMIYIIKFDTLFERHNRELHIKIHYVQLQQHSNIVLCTTFVEHIVVLTIIV